MHHLGRQNYCVERPIKPSERTVCGRKTLRKEKKKTSIVVTFACVLSWVDILYLHFISNMNPKARDEGVARRWTCDYGSPRSAITL